MVTFAAFSSVIYKPVNVHVLSRETANLLHTLFGTALSTRPRFPAVGWLSPHRAVSIGRELRPGTGTPYTSIGVSEPGTAISFIHEARMIKR